MREKLAVLVLVLVASGIGGGSCKRESPPPSEGSSFAEVWWAVSSDPYQALPHHEVTVFSFFDGFTNLLLDASERTLSDTSDLLPPFQKLLHPNGICLAGTWNITEDTPYTGYFATGSSALIVARASTALTETTTAGTRAFGLAGKLFPTLDESSVVPTANFFTIENLGGTWTEHILDAEMTNDIIQINPQGDGSDFFDLALGAVVAEAFIQADHAFDITQTLERQLYPIGEAGLASGEMAVTPRWMKLVGAPGTERIDEADFRDELRIEHYADGIELDIYVADVGTRLGDKEWGRIGFIHFDETVASYSCDHRLHFTHPVHR